MHRPEVFDRLAVERRFGVVLVGIAHGAKSGNGRGGLLRHRDLVVSIEIVISFVVDLLTGGRRILEFVDVDGVSIHIIHFDCHGSLLVGGVSN
jgi:hypothetical protein